VRELADGRVYSGRRAKELRLIDSLGGLEEAVRKAAELAGIPGKPRLVRPKRAFRWTDLIEWLGSRTGTGSLLTGWAPGSPVPALSSPKLPLYLME
jgi:protease-4